VFLVKLLVLILVVFLLVGFGIVGIVLRGVLGLRAMLRGEAQPEARPTGWPPRRGGWGGANADVDTAAPERMLACAVCGVHVPESEGVHTSEGFFCCEEHRLLAREEAGGK